VDDESRGGGNPARAAVPAEPVAPSRRGWPRRALPSLAPLLAYTALAVLVFLPAWEHPTTRAIGFSGDPQQTIWFLSWTPWAITHGVNPFFTTHMNFPDGVNLMWNSWAPLLGFVLWPITATGGPVLAFNVLQTGGIALSAWVAYLAIRRYLPGWAALAGGLAYGFGPFLMNQAHGHAKVSFGVLPPLLFILLDEICVRQRRSPRLMGPLLGLALAAQAFILEEGVVLGVLAALVGVAALALLFRRGLRSRRRHALSALLWGAGTFAAITVAPLALQLFGAGRVHGNVPGADTYLADPVAVAVPTHLQLLSWGSLSTRVETFAGNAVETATYLGIPLVVLLLVTVVLWRRRPLVRWAGLTGLALVVLSLGPHLHLNGRYLGIPLPYAVVQGISHVGSALPAHLFVYVNFVAALLLAVFLVELVRARHRLATAAGGLLVLAAMLTLLPALPFATTAVQVPSFFTTARVESMQRGSVALIAPFVTDGSRDEPMVWQAAAGMRFKMPEGYFIRPNEQAAGRADGPAPTVTSRAMTDIAEKGRAPELTAELRRAVLRDLARWRVAAVLVGPMRHRAEMERFFTALLGRPGERSGGVLVWHLSWRGADPVVARRPSALAGALTPR